MPSQRQLFLNHVAQTSRMPLMIEVDRAEGLYIYDTQGKKYLDLNSGICVSSLGHCHPAVIDAIQAQSKRFMHTMVYGEHVQQPQVALANRLSEVLPPQLSCVYFANSGSEAIEGALKLAKKSTGRPDIVAMRNSYHGSTQGAEALRSDSETTRVFRPLAPGVRHIDFNVLEQLSVIDHRTAAVVVEPVQAEAGIILPNSGYLEAIKARCEAVGALMILDEIQTGYGRTGKLFAFEHHDFVPDILTIGKAMGGGMPIAAFISSKELMSSLAYKPALGHITTFGGHPVTCAAALACLNTLISEELIPQVEDKAQLMKQLLKHELIAEVRNAGLMMAVQLTKKRYLKYVVNHVIEHGALIDWFIFNQQSFRLAPPLIIDEQQIRKGAEILLAGLDYALTKKKNAP